MIHLEFLLELEHDPSPLIYKRNLNTKRVSHVLNDLSWLNKLPLLVQPLTTNPIAFTKVSKNKKVTFLNCGVNSGVSVE